MEGLSSLDKKASAAKNIATTMAGAIAAAGAVKGIDSIVDAVGNHIDKKKHAHVITYAKQKHPELRKVDDKELQRWMGAFHKLSPSLSTDKVLGASLLMMTNNYGGNVDFATAKSIADAGDKSHRQHNSQSQTLSYIQPAMSVMRG